MDNLNERLHECADWIAANATGSYFAHDELTALHKADTVLEAVDAIEMLMAENEALKTELKPNTTLTEIKYRWVKPLYDIIERLKRERNQWKNAWATANKLYEEIRDENVRLKKELDRQMSICGR